MLRNGVKIDFTSCEMKWYNGDDKMIVSFSCQKHGQLDELMVRDRLVQGAKVTTTPTLTMVYDGKVVVPVMSLVGFTTKLQAREALGTRTPTSESMKVLGASGMLTRGAVRRWLNELGRSKGPFSNEKILTSAASKERTSNYR
ncbi:RNA-dependent DNA polymerase [Phytophthora cinnamomi]|uniref:RNA-dependent DNA polymerase n=1 Tax=Phytophthora cinnamomi TaxID=4785 RepID=UPI003559E805|nr:RNA-dependent DNA polymerase [Phytophthora cinnamomi]